MRSLILVAAALSVAGCAVAPVAVGAPSDPAPLPARPLEDAHNRLCAAYPLLLLTEPMLARVPHSAEIIAAFHAECAV